MRGGWRRGFGCRRLRRAHGLNVALCRGRPLVAPGRILLVAGWCLYLRHHDRWPGDDLLSDDPGDARSALDVGLLDMIEGSMFAGRLVRLFVGGFLGGLLAGSGLFDRRGTFVHHLIARVLLPALM